MPSYTRSPEEEVAYQWCIKNGIKIAPHAASSDKNNDHWWVDVEAKYKARAELRSCAAANSNAKYRCAMEVACSTANMSDGLLAYTREEPRFAFTRNFHSPLTVDSALKQVRTERSKM